MSNSYTRSIRAYLVFFLFSICSPYLVFSQDYNYLQDDFLIRGVPPLNRKMKILVATEIFPYQTHTFIVNQIVGLLDAGHDVSVYSKYKQKRTVKNQLIADYNLIERTYYDELPDDLETYDILLCQFGTMGNYFLPIKKERNLKAKLVTCFRGQDISSFVKKKPTMYDKLLKEGDLFLPVCGYFRDKLIHLGAAPEKIVVQHSAIDSTKFAARSSIPPLNNTTIKIITVGRLVNKKGHEYVLRALAEVIKRYPAIEYTILGGGSSGALLKLAKQLNVDTHVKFLGLRTPEEVIKHLRESHVFILASITADDGDQEGIPNVLKEAMAVGLPVISTNHSGIPELVQDGFSGFIVPERDVAALATKLTYFIEHPELWAPMGAAARAIVEREYEFEQESKRLEQILSCVLQKE